MFVPFSARDFLDRTETMYGERVGVVDGHNQPAAPIEHLTYRRLAEHLRTQTVGLDDLGVDRSKRMAIVSRNSAVLLPSFLGVRLRLVADACQRSGSRPTRSATSSSTPARPCCSSTGAGRALGRRRVQAPLRPHRRPVPLRRRAATVGAHEIHAGRDRYCVPCL